MKAAYTIDDVVLLIESPGKVKGYVIGVWEDWTGAFKYMVRWWSPTGEKHEQWCTAVELAKAVSRK
jgi:hypothetical protein